MHSNLNGVIFAALNGKPEQFKSLCNSSVHKGSTALLTAVINSQTPKEIIEAFIQFKGEPTEEDLLNWLNIADRDNCPRAIEVIGDKLLAKTPTQKRLKLPATMYIRHDPARGANWMAKAMTTIQKTSLESITAKSAF